MASFGQPDRFAKLSTTFGDDALVLTRFTGKEGMSSLFDFRVEAVSETESDLNFDSQIGQNVTVTLKTKGQGDRKFVGTCAEALRLGKGPEGYYYIMTLRPALWLLSKRVNSRSFQEMKVTDIISAIFDDYAGSFKYKVKCQETYPKLEYCVQHRESDLNFVLRLMEGSGISYHFLHDDNQTVWLCDGDSQYEAAPGGSRKFSDPEKFHVREDEHFYRWMPERRFTTNKGTLTDYKLQQPGDDNLGEYEGDAKFSPKLEDYRHPFPHHLGKETSADHGKTYAEIRARAERGEDGVRMAEGTCGSLIPGFTVSLEEHPTASENGKYVITSCKHSIQAQNYRTDGGPDDFDVPYRGEYELIKDGRFVPPIVTPKPVVGGPQTGVVVGNNTAGTDNEIYTDEHGRIKVHMHWNREDKGDKKGQTMWCRVAQVWAGPQAKWGAIFIPRVGMEVLIDFLDGDPDRPIVTGTMYHKDNKPPYDLGGEAFKAGWKSNFEKGAGYHEIVMNDKVGEEKIHAHTTKDLLTQVDNNETREVTKDRDTTIGVNDTLDVGQILEVTAGVKISLTVGPSSIVIEQSGITVKAPMIMIEATGMLTTKAGGMAEHTAGGIMTIKGSLVTIN